MTHDKTNNPELKCDGWHVTQVNIWFNEGLKDMTLLEKIEKLIATEKGTMSFSSKRITDVKAK